MLIAYIKVLQWVPCRTHAVSTQELFTKIYMTSRPSFNTIDIFYRMKTMKTQTPLGRMSMTMTLTIICVRKVCVKCVHFIKQHYIYAFHWKMVQKHWKTFQAP